MICPKLFLDTNVCIDAATGKIPADEWSRVRRHISRNFRYCISFVTMKELFAKLARGGDDFFEQNKKPLNILLGPGNRRFLPYPSVFALRTVLGLQSISRKHEYVSLSDEEWAESVLTAVLQAPSKAQLKTGIPVRNSLRRKQRFDLDHFDQHENKPQTEFADILQGIREDRNDMPEPMTWAAWILKYHELTP